MKKRVLAALLTGVLAVGLLAGCSSSESSESSESEEGTEETEAAEEGTEEAAADEGSMDSALTICILTASGSIDDGSFNQNCYEGIQEFLAENENASCSHVEVEDLSQCTQAVQDTIADYDVLVLPGYNFATIAEIAEANPDKDIILIDSAASDAEGNEVEVANIWGATYAEAEPGFLCGVAAALETKSGKVAVVNGIAYPSNVNYQYGFMSGVNYAVKHLGATAEIVEIPSYAGTDVLGNDVGGNYVGDFGDVATGKIIGDALINEGCDIIFVAAGESGNGVFTAAKEADGVYVIGCDVDQYDDGANGDTNIVLTSGLKIMDTKVYEQLNAIKDGTFEGGNPVLDATTDSIGIVTEEGRQQMSDETREALEPLFDEIKYGNIVPAAFTNDYTPDDFPGLND